MSLRKRPVKGAAKTQIVSSSSSPSITQITPTATRSTDSTNKRWEVDGVVISDLLLKYREEAFNKGEKNILETYQEEPSLNNIFLFDDSNWICPDSSLEYGFDRNTWEDIIEECNELYLIHSLSKKTESIIKKFTKLYIPLLDAYVYTYIDIPSLRITAYSPESAKKSDKMESTFSISAVSPLMLAFFKETNILTRNGQPMGKLLTKIQTKIKQAYVFPDLSMDFDYDVMPTQHLLIWGVKPPHKKLEQAVDWVLPSLQIQ
ncbi:hypothetical protein BDC45DRAFT_536856 [Circinella umbellata]|nr:hypothetical protein BDC45DRAFT_536856 [Circinella umbellata]